MAGQSSTADASGFELRHGVIVDRAQGAIYLGEPGGGIDAVDLSTGRSLWRSAEGALPLALHGRYLIVQREEARPGPRLPIVVLDVRAGGRQVVESTIALPAGVHAHVAETLERVFRASAAPDRTGFLVSWTYTETLVQGVARDPGEPPPQRALSGTEHVELPQATAAPSARVRNEVAERLMKAHGLPHVPWRAGAVLAGTEGGRGARLTLKRWDAETGAALPDRALLAKALVALPSADHTYLLASERVGSGGPGDPEYRWSIFLLETGERAGELRRDVSAAPFVVWNGSIVFEAQPYSVRRGTTSIDEPLKLVALRLSSGDPIWDRAVRDVTYRGPAPPGA